MSEDREIGSMTPSQSEGSNGKVTLPPDLGRERPRLELPWIHAIWLFGLAGVFVVKGLDRGAITGHYFQAADDWLAGTGLYAMTGHGFLYLPQSAILFMPFAKLPPALGEIVWRLVGLSVFAYGLFRCWAALGSWDWRSYRYVALIGMLVSGYSLSIGQATLLMTGVVLVGFSALGQERFRSAGIWLSLAVAIKPLAVVFLLLAVALERRIRLSVLVSIVVLLLAPFAFQQPGYVWSQYRDFVSSLRITARLGNEGHWSQLFGMLRTVGIMTPSLIQTVLRILAALGTLFLSWTAHRRFSHREAVFWTYGLGATYLMLFNPRNEASTYCVLGPALALFLAREIGQRRHWAPVAGLVGAAVLITGDYEIGKHFVPAGAPVVWLAPLATVLFSVYLGVRLRSALSQHPQHPS